MRLKIGTGTSDEKTLFPSSYGEAINPDVLMRKVSRYIESSGIGRGGSCHLFPHLRNPYVRKRSRHKVYSNTLSLIPQKLSDLHRRKHQKLQEVHS